jgi:hypothetical protein
MVSTVAGALAGAGPWALAVGSWAFIAWLVVSGRVVPRARHEEVIAYYRQAAERDAASLAARDAQVTELLSHSRLAAQAWDSLKREAEAA